jgi:hypothetical protein
MVIVLVISVINRFVNLGLVLLNDAWLYTGRRGNRRGDADGITENRKK